MTTDVRLVTSTGFSLVLADNVCTRALRETAADVLVVAHKRLRKNPDAVLVGRFRDPGFKPFWSVVRRAGPSLTEIDSTP